ncbi:MAG TPA: DUF1003 domain-containing protein [Steroidobacteraceae bacterium]|jgi:uncharacterized membrane protein|nr:DUF1003 domain-containing protein [Steroidobacteraceae bacterium]
MTAERHSPPDARGGDADEKLPDPISRNITDIRRLQQRERAALRMSERRLERILNVLARPSYPLALLGFVIVWLAVNTLGALIHLTPFDPPPFPWLQGLITLTALLTTTVVLTVQRRQSALAAHQAHLDLQINLLTEQKVSKVIHLLEELRTDLPMVSDRSDPHASDLQRPTRASQVVSALRETGVTEALDGERDKEHASREARGRKRATRRAR